MKTKTCTLCKVTQPLTEFHKSSRNKDGHNCWCKTCVNKREKARWQRVKAQKEGSVVITPKNLKDLGFPYILGKIAW